MAKEQFAVFYVNNKKSSETVSETANFKIIRKGKMEVIDDRNGKIYHSTKDLLDAKVTWWHFWNGDVVDLDENEPYFEVVSKTTGKTIDSGLYRLGEAEYAVKYLERIIKKEPKAKYKY